MPIKCFHTSQMGRIVFPLFHQTCLKICVFEAKSSSLERPLCSVKFLKAAFSLASRVPREDIKSLKIM